MHILDAKPLVLVRSYQSNPVGNTMVICNIQFLCLKSFVDTKLQCIGQSEKFKASDEGKAFLCNSTCLYLKTRDDQLWKIY